MKKSIAYALSCILTFAVGYGMYEAYSHTHATESMQLPKPTGALGIGTTDYHLIDTHRHERHSNNPNDHRELMLQIWYPGRITGNEEKALYAHPVIVESVIKQLQEPPAHIPADKLDYLYTLRTHSVKNAPILAGHYPVIIFSPGGGASLNMYTSLLEELASHGYIVVGLNHPYVTDKVIFPDGRIITEEKIVDQDQRRKNRETECRVWVQDIQFVVDQLLKMNADEKSMLHNKLDLAHLGVFGHSFGGSASVGACQIDTRFKAGADIDGKLYDLNQEQPLRTPFMFIVAPHSDKTLQPIKDLIKNATAPTKYNEIPKADHGSFTDFYVIAKWEEPSQLDPLEGIQITRTLLVNFFDTYLKAQQGETSQKTQTAEKHSLFIQGSFDNPVLTSIKNTLNPAINTIIKEELGLSIDDDFKFFLPKDWQRLTLYYVDEVSVDAGIDIVADAVKNIVENKRNEFALNQAHIAPEVAFFGNNNDELVIMVNDPAGELSRLNSAIKGSMHQCNASHGGALYNEAQSERFPYHPHIGLGRIRTASITDRIKDASQTKSIFDRIRERILAESKRVSRALLNTTNASILFEKVAIFDQQSRSCVREYPL